MRKYLRELKRFKFDDWDKMLKLWWRLDAWHIKHIWKMICWICEYCDDKMGLQLIEHPALGNPNCAQSRWHRWCLHVDETTTTKTWPVSTSLAFGCDAAVDCHSIAYLFFQFKWIKCNAMQCICNLTHIWNMIDKSNDSRIQRIR